jgi:hypothetical protein
MTRLCKWCDTPLPKDTHHLRKYCVGDNCRELRRKKYKKQYMPERKQSMREYNQRLEVRKRRRVARQKYAQSPKGKKSKQKYEQRPEVRERKTRLARKSNEKRMDKKLLAILLELDFSDETMKEFGFERVKEDATE